MSNYKRQTIGTVLRGKKNADGTTSPDYIKIRTDLKESVTLNAGDFLNLESKAQQLASLDAAVQAGKLSPENGEKARERISKIPDFVRFEIIQVQK